MKIRLSINYLLLATLVALGVGLGGCASNSDPSTATYSRSARKPLPNLDRVYHWGSTPGAGQADVHSRD